MEAFMQLITDNQRARMLANGERMARDDADDPLPVVRLFMPDGSCSWLLAALDPDYPNFAFGLVDRGGRLPQFAIMRLSEMSGLRDSRGQPVECDLGFAADRPIRAHAASTAMASRHAP